MAANGSQQGFGPDEVHQAMLTMRGGDSDKKKKAHEYLELFQKSSAAWTTTITILQSNAEADIKLFAATTLRGKVSLAQDLIP
ncbi:hypothetical protein PC116_g29737 [Phytophthora cactorum]|nr:hypothetical protein PC116_g29737 [Phytophthora cactorum]